MKYLKTYENFQLNEYYDSSAEDDDSTNWLGFFIKTNINHFLRKNYNKSEYLGIEGLRCRDQELYSLKGIEKLPNLKMLNVGFNNLKSLEGIENCKKLEKLYCYNNKLENLHGIEDLINLKTLHCSCNNLKNLNEILNLQNITQIETYDNPFEEPIPIEILKRSETSEWKINYIYGDATIKKLGWVRDNPLYIKFKSYEFQKMFLTKYPERFEDLSPFGYVEGIKEEFPALFRGKEWGFFDLSES